jgi:hypothetical protein
MNHNERIAHDVGEWVGEDVSAGVQHFRNSGFENRLHQRLAAEEAGPSRRLWLLIAASAAVLAVVVGTFIYLQRPFFQIASGRESIRTFFAEYSTLQRLQASPDTMAGPSQTILLPGLREGRLSRQEMAELFRSSLPQRDLGSVGLEAPGEANASPRELKQAIDRFFSTTLKSIKEKT